MDPIGLAFENFNALGMWRDTERKQAIQAQGNLITGESFTSVRRAQADPRQRPPAGVLRHAVAQAADLRRPGRGTEYYDVETIDGIVNRLNAERRPISPHC